MLESIKYAHCEHGRSQKEMAREVGVQNGTFYAWTNGRLRIPEHRRKSLERAFGAPVDWEAYEREYRGSSPETPKKSPVSAGAAPERPNTTETQAPTPDATQGAGGWFDGIIFGNNGGEHEQP